MPPAEKRDATFAKAKYGAWLVCMALAVGSLYFTQTANGLRRFHPEFGQKLHTFLPMGVLRNSPFWAKLDIASLVSLMLLFAVTYSWKELLTQLLDKTSTSPWEVDNYRRILLAAGSVLVVADSTFMYFALSGMSWGGGVTFSFKPLLLTVTFVASLVVASLVSMRLKKEIEILEDK